LADLKPNGGDYYKSFWDKYDTQSNDFKCGKNDEQVVKLLYPGGVNTGDHFDGLLSSICKYTDKRFQSLKSSPMSCFQVFDYRFWPKNKPDLLRHGDDDIKTLLAHFSEVLPGEMNVPTTLEQWLDLKLLVSQSAQRTLRPQEMYSSLLASKSDDLKSILTIVEIMMVLSVSTATCERSFSAMNRIKTNLKTNMKQETLQDIMVVSTSRACIKDFSPNEAIRVWVNSGTKKKHYITTVQCSSRIQLAAASAEAQDEDEQEPPPLPVFDFQDDDAHD